MILEKIKKIELEITNGCNAACPGCTRTQHLEKIKSSKINLEDIKKTFPSKEFIDGKKFKFCGVLGDPAFHPECIDMVEYLAEQGGWCQLSTNGAIQSAEWWYRLGKLSKETKNVDVSFCIDGHEETNHIYRINTSWNVIERNIKSYVDGGDGEANATWIFIVFDHNEYELEKARNHAYKLGIKFATRTGMRNSYESWVAKIKRKDLKTNNIIEQQKIISTTNVKEHSKKEKVKDLDKFIENYSNNIIDLKQKDAIIKSIQCKWIHEGEIFISADLRVWPCCFLWSDYFKQSENVINILSKFGDTWNSLRQHSLDDILNHEWYKTLLELSWDPEHNLHIKRCIQTCAYNKAYHNEIIYDK